MFFLYYFFEFKKINLPGLSLLVLLFFYFSNIASASMSYLIENVEASFGRLLV
jgi:hypothetical protein